MKDRPRVDLETNIPLVGVLKYCDHRSTEYGEKLKLTILVEESEQYRAGESELWVPIALLEGLVSGGAVTTGGTAEKPEYRVQGRPRIEVLRREVRKEGSTRKTAHTAIRRLDVAQKRATANATEPSSGPQEPVPIDRDAITKAWLRVGEEYAAARVLARHHLGTEASEEVIQSATATILIRAERVAPEASGKGYAGLAASIDRFLRSTRSRSAA